MKRLAIVGGCALTLVLASTSRAPAWVNFKFGAGINWHWQSGGNNFLWGLFRNGQPPGYEYGAYPGPGHPGFPTQPFPGNQYYGPQDFQFFGNQGITPSHPAPPSPSPAPTTQSTAAHQVPLSAAGPFYYQPVSQRYYYYSNYHYPYTLESAYGSWNNPTYWNR